jgi:hypothetical protein
MKTVCSSETLPPAYQTTRRHIPHSSSNVITTIPMSKNHAMMAYGERGRYSSIYLYSMSQSWMKSVSQLHNQAAWYSGKWKRILPRTGIEDKSSGPILLHMLVGYTPEGRGFETRWNEWILPIYLILPAALGPGVYSDSNRNKYQK